MRWFIPLLLFAGACSVRTANPCNHVSEACLTLHVDPSTDVKAVDDLLIEVARYSPQHPPDAGRSTNLPVAVGLAFDAITTDTPVDIKVTGFLNKGVVGTGLVSAIVVVGKQNSLHVTLRAAQSGDDLGTFDDTSLGDASDAAAAFDANPNGEPDLAMPDLAVVPAIARQVAPLSTATVTLQKPKLRWELGAGAGDPVVDLCADRACTVLLSGVTATIGADRQSAIPSTALPPGWVYWRVRVVAGADSTTSSTWQFWVPKADAATLTDTSTGSTLDVNGDGNPDLLVRHKTGVHLYLGKDGGGFQRVDIIPLSAASHFAANAGDVNGDGLSDFLIGDSSGSVVKSGYFSLYLGTPSPVATDWNGTGALKRIDVHGADGERLGGIVRGLGDVNGDGYGDILVSRSGVGKVQVYLGARTPTTALWNSDTNGYRIDVTDPDSTVSGFGSALGAGGDINGDGYADFLLGSQGATTTKGAAYVYFGSSMPSSSIWNGVSAAQRFDLTDPSAVGGSYGARLTTVGDINGDGLSDFVVSSPNTTQDGNSVGLALLYLGKASPSASAWNTTERFYILSPEGGAPKFGTVSNAGDVNGDGFDDFVIGASESTSAASPGGIVHLYLGSSAINNDWNGSSPVRRHDLVNPDSGFPQFGGSVGAVGDINHDGFADFAVGAPAANTSTGVVHLYSGASPVDLTTWNGATPSKRTDIPGPDGTNTSFGILGYSW